MKRICSFLTLIMCCSISAFADLVPYYVELKLSSEKATYSRNEIIPLKLSFKNTSDGSRQLLFQVGAARQSKMITLSYYSVSGNQYTLMAEEQISLTVDTSRFLNITIEYPQSGAVVEYPIFVNDSVNFLKHIESNYKLPELPNGTYQVLARYNPWCNRLAPSIYNKLGDFKSSEDSIDPRKLSIPDFGLVSNYISLTIVDKDTAEYSSGKVSITCNERCKFCNAIDHSRWSKVERIIDRQTFSRGSRIKKSKSRHWTEPHRNVAMLYNYPSAILASLPTYTSRRIIFRNEEGYFYFQGSWQIGKVHRLRSRLSFLFYWWPFDGPIKTSSVDYFKLQTFAGY
jgi:hypothetical protein